SSRSDAYEHQHIQSVCHYASARQRQSRALGAISPVDFAVGGVFQLTGLTDSSWGEAIMKKMFGLLAIVALCLMAKPAVAHHALQAEFDTAKRGEFTGTLTKLALINPHVRWFFDVKKPDGTVAKWEITGAGPQALR